MRRECGIGWGTLSDTCGEWFRLSESSVVGLLENVLNATRSGAFTHELRQGESALPIEIEDLVRSRVLKRITADPVDHVVPAAHTTCSFDPGPCAQVIAQAPGEQRRQRCLEFGRGDRYQSPWGLE